MSVKTTVTIAEEFDDLSLRVAKVDGVFESIYLHGGAPSMNFLKIDNRPKKAAITLRKIADFLDTL